MAGGRVVLIPLLVLFCSSFAHADDIASTATTAELAKGETSARDSKGSRGAKVAADASSQQSVAARTAGTLHFPFIAEQGFILIDGKVDDTPGVFMLDTGTPFTFFVNREFVPLPKGESGPQGHAGSGQAIAIELHRQPHVISLPDGMTITPTETHSGNFGFVAKGLNIPLLGFIGVKFLHDYRFTIDYKQQLITLEPLTSSPHSSGRETAASREKPLAVIRFTNKDNSPHFTVTLGGQPIAATLDTGSQGGVALTQKTRDRLTAAGLMGGQDMDEIAIDLRSLNYENLRFDLPGLKDYGRGRDEITLGYSFLHNYRSVWDYKAMTVTLYAP